jgi:mannose-6-phosphate isomerase-like protein (cupin superfamily)
MRKPLGRGLSLIVQLERLGRRGSHYSLHGGAVRGGSGWVALGSTSRTPGTVAPMTQASGANEPFAERLAFGEGTVVLRATAATTGGALTIFEEVPPLLDTPPHVHSREDELFYILEGEHIVQRGQMEFGVGPGDAVFLPRGVPHAQRRVVPGEGRLLVVCSPAGFEEFFRDLAAADADGRLGPDAYAAASERAGISWL